MSSFSQNAEGSLGVFSKAHDLKKRIFYTLFILIIYRFGTYIPIPGIDPTSLQEIVGGNQRSLLGMFNVFAGGAVQRMAIFALGIMPYISASIIIQLLTGVTDYFKNLKEQGELGRQKNHTVHKIRNCSFSNYSRLWSCCKFRKFSRNCS
jgi:preprotein translocase subunit SecY